MVRPCLLGLRNMQRVTEFNGRAIIDCMLTNLKPRKSCFIGLNLAQLHCRCQYATLNKLDLLNSSELFSLLQCRWTTTSISFCIPSASVFTCCTSLKTGSRYVLSQRCFYCFGCFSYWVYALPSFSGFLQLVSIACYAKRCISYRKSVRLTVWPSITRWYHAKTT